ncbi:hypothetical protein [Streptomyces sp. H34-S4]|uniref:hypothetical protein n=1 Tax=Streptomyces sp. H34-S4 TaxID=2996463 RepID=UPI00226EF050|nr:hypothetical protein [Streptomyces sp. H34-S4]MCY0935145.1 hypothetical protein [Streptomyces sp. H34-S4]
MTPYSLAFYMDAVTTGTLLGVGPADPPDRVTEALGSSFGEHSSDRGSMFRDYGLAEFFWERTSGSDPWKGHHVTIQVHRLAYRDPELVNAAVRARYGRFTYRLRFDKLRRLLERRGVPLVEIPEYSCNAPYFRTFLQPDSRVAVTVIGAHGEYSTPDNLRVGDVYNIQTSMTPEDEAARRAQTG